MTNRYTYIVDELLFYLTLGQIRLRVIILIDNQTKI